VITSLFCCEVKKKNTTFNKHLVRWQSVAPIWLQEAHLSLIFLSSDTK